MNPCKKDGLNALALPEDLRLITLISLRLLSFARHRIVYHRRYSETGRQQVPLPLRGFGMTKESAS